MKIETRYTNRGPFATMERYPHRRKSRVPKDVPPGTYRIGVELYDRDGSLESLRLEATPGVTSDSHGRYDIGTVTVTRPGFPAFHHRTPGR